MPEHASPAKYIRRVDYMETHQVAYPLSYIYASMDILDAESVDQTSNSLSDLKQINKLHETLIRKQQR
jgi:hypothetical protein